MEETGSAGRRGSDAFWVFVDGSSYSRLLKLKKKDFKSMKALRTCTSNYIFLEFKTFWKKIKTQLEICNSSCGH